MICITGNYRETAYIQQKIVTGKISKNAEGVKSTFIGVNLEAPVSRNKFRKIYRKLKGSAEALTRQELTRLTLLTQTLVGLPVYTTEMASGWLGVGIDAIRTAIWKSDPPTLKTIKPGHDVLIEHGELVRFLNNGN